MAILPISVSSGVPPYLCNPLHRNRTPRKSQWTISENAELHSFEDAFNRTWLLSDIGWGLHFENNHPANLGVAQDHKTSVFVAKFVNDKNTWHGYPADHQRNNQDIPDIQIRRKWLKENILPRRTVLQLGKGQPCSL
jgi:hypothetical protein